MSLLLASDRNADKALAWKSCGVWQHEQLANGRREDHHCDCASGTAELRGQLTFSRKPQRQNHERSKFKTGGVSVGKGGKSGIVAILFALYFDSYYADAACGLYFPHCWPPDCCRARSPAELT